ncbi:MAG: Ig-like domain-containing protein [Anaeroplasmataceae bacterium]|nr:Ig-like domain-containing protein [Anaeroplasmataceae bacterium]
MKKKVIIFSTLFLLILTCFIGTAISLDLKVQKDGSTSPSFMATSSERRNPLKNKENQAIDVGEEYEFTFMPYVKEEQKQSLQFEIEDEEILYLTKSKFKVIGLKAGISKVTISSADYYAEVEIKVRLANLSEDGDFSSFSADAEWKTGNQTVNGWRLYTGSGSNDLDNKQVVKIVEIDETNEANETIQNKVVYYNHQKEAQSVLYRTYDVGAGQYYVTARMKTENVSKTTYLRVNQDNKNTVVTDTLTGSTDWVQVSTPIFRIEEGEPNPLKIELYIANSTGEIWFDDIQIYRIIKHEYLSISSESMTEDLEIGEQRQINCFTNPTSKVDYEFEYEVEDESIVEVSKTGVMTAKAAGMTTITIKDEIFGYTTKLDVIVGTKNKISAKVNDNNNLVYAKEDTTLEIPVQVTNSTSYQIVKYSGATYGDYYIKNNKIYYTPKYNVFTTNERDSFEVVVLDDKAGGFCIVKITVDISAENDPCIATDFWLTTPKNTALEWTTSKNKYNYSAGGKYNGTSADMVYNGAYLQITCDDVEVIYPYTTRNQFREAGTEATLRKAKVDLYQSIYATAADGSFKFTTSNGGTVEILRGGKIDEIQDRYYSQTGKIIHGLLYNYTPKKGFYGYDTFNFTLHNGEREDVVSATIYVLPGDEEFKFKNLDLDGIYLLTNNAWLEEVREGYENDDPYICRWVDFYENQLRGHNLTGIPANARSAIEQFAILYQVTGEKEYAERCWEQLSVIVGKDRGLDWGGSSNGFLDAAMVTYSVAFAYNFIRDTLTEEQKAQTIRALYEEGFYFFETLTNVNVLLHGNNHCLLICGNLALAALSTLSYEGKLDVTTNGKKSTIDVQEMSVQVIITALKFLQTGLVHYSESGGFPEGPAYSIYAHRNMVHLLATLRNLYGEEDGKIYSFGLSDIKGIMDYTNYPLYTSTPNYESFYYAESEYSNNQPALMWYTRIDESNINAAVLSKLADENEQYNILNLLWYTPGLFDKVNLHEMDPLDYLLEDHELATFRSAFGDEMAIFTGLKGFDTDSGAYTHRNLDSGTFEIYAFGERFIGNFSDELYSADVGVPNGFWDYDYQRWTYYRKSAQGQNTLVFNPEKNPVLQQSPYEYAPIVNFNSNKNGGYAVINLSDVYNTDVTTAYRGLKFFDNRSKIMIQDEFELRDTSTVYWSAHTEAKIEIINEKLARLILNGKSLYAYINSEIGTFSVMPATALPGTIGEFCHLDNTDINKLIIKLENVTSGVLNVVFVPTLEEITEFEKYEIVSLADWTLEDLPIIPDISVENIEVNAEFGNQFKYVFNPYQYDYIVKLDNTVKEVPDLTVAYNSSKYEIKIEKSKLFNQFTKVIVTDIATKETREYRYRFIVDTIIDEYEYEDYTQITVADVSGNEGASNLIDGRNSTTFTSDEREIVIFEFEKVSKLTNVLMRFSGGLLNTYYFDIYYSLDGETWTTCYFGGQSTNNMGNEVYSLGTVEAKFIKIVFNGNNHSEKVTISRVEFNNNNYDAQEGPGEDPGYNPGEDPGYNPGEDPIVEKKINNLPIILGSLFGVIGLAALAIAIYIIIKRRIRK